MSLCDGDSLQLDGPQDMDAGWFVRMREKYAKADDKKELREIAWEEVNALQGLYDRSASAEDIAYKITHPIATSPVPGLGNYSDETAALRTLWYIVVEALVAWPVSRVPDLLVVLSAIGRLPRTVQVHNGEATNGEGTRTLTWDEYPWFPYAWRDSLRELGDIVRLAQHGSPELSQSGYIYRKDIEAQLLARGCLPFDKRIVGFVANTLEREPDRAIPANAAIAYNQNRLEFQVPAIASLMRYSGTKLFEWVVRKDQDQQRWIRWEERLGAIADERLDSYTRTAARVASVKMQAVRARS